MPRTRAPAQPNQSLATGLACLQQVVGAPRPIGCREVARRLGMTPTRVSRVLGTLAHLGMLEQDSSRKYVAGPALHVLAAQSMRASGLLAAVLPNLRALRVNGQTVALGVLWEGWVCYLFHEQGDLDVANAFEHDLCPAFYSSIGIALLAAGDSPHGASRVPEFDAKMIAGYNPDACLADARRNGVAILHHRSGEVSMGMAIGNPALAGIAVAGVMNPSVARLTKIRADLAREAAVINSRLAGKAT